MRPTRIRRNNKKDKKGNHLAKKRRNEGLAEEFAPLGQLFEDHLE
jgi:hypothetical protein